MVRKRDSPPVIGLQCCHLWSYLSLAVGDLFNIQVGVIKHHLWRSVVLSTSKTPAFGSNQKQRSVDNGFGLLDGSLRSSGGYNYDGLVIHGLKSSRWFFVLDSMFPMCFSVVGKPLFCGMIDIRRKSAERLADWSYSAN
ncbi:hypothetical protein HID58_085663 [Brassica napus]|uniref:Uncharacterized protein n=1 Tax=Brassica napus TaxID=3708 RepID=A0ABQ7XNA8_BRANA|nr:hypothetical protein HID58_085663 [Brassica napus]